MGEYGIIVIVGGVIDGEEEEEMMDKMGGRDRPRLAGGS